MRSLCIHNHFFFAASDTHNFVNAYGTGEGKFTYFFFIFYSEFRFFRLISLMCLQKMTFFLLFHHRLYKIFVVSETSKRRINSNINMAYRHRQ